MTCAVSLTWGFRYNIDPFDSHSDEEVWRALERANLKEKVGMTSEQEDDDLPPGLLRQGPAVDGGGGRGREFLGGGETVDMPG